MFDSPRIYFPYLSPSDRCTGSKQQKLCEHSNRRRAFYLLERRVHVDHRYHRVPVSPRRVPARANTRYYASNADLEEESANIGQDINAIF